MTNFEKWKERYDLLLKYVKQNPREKKLLEKNGTITRKAIIDKDGQKIKIGVWLELQRKYIMKKYQDMTIEQIDNDENIPEEDKYKMKKLLEFGVSYQKESKKEWNDKFNLLEKYINSSEENKQYFKENKKIPIDAVIENNNGSYINIGFWIINQRQVLMRKYQEKTIEEIKGDKDVPEEDKYKMEKLLALGVGYKSDRAQINKLRRESAKRAWDEKFELLEEYINTSSNIKSDFEEKGHIHHNTVIQKNGKKIRLGVWVDTQKQTLMKKYLGKTIKEIENDENISEEDKYKMKKLLELGVSYPKDIKDMYEDKKSDYIDIWKANFKELEEYVNSDEETKKEFIKRGTLPLTGNKQKDEKIDKINRWIVIQKQYLMKQYHGKTIEEIEEDNSINKTHKYKMKKLLSIGVKYSRIYGQRIGKATYDSETDKCDEAEEIIKNLKQKNIEKSVN